MSAPASNGSAPTAELAAMALEEKANVGSPAASANGSAAASPAPAAGPGLKDQFQAFSKFGDCKSDGKQITLSQSDKWMKQAKVIDKQITTTDTGIHFKKFKLQKIGLSDYKKFLEDLAKTKNIPMGDIVTKLSTCGTPGVNQVNVSGSQTRPDGRRSSNERCAELIKNRCAPLFSRLGKRPQLSVG